MPGKLSKAKPPSTLKELQHKIETIHKIALDTMNQARVPRKTKENLKRIAEQAMSVSRELNDPRRNGAGRLKAAREFLWFLVTFWRSDGSHT